MTEARVTRSPVMGNYHAGFWSVSGPGDRPTDRSGAGAASTRFHVRSSSAAPLEAVVSEWDWFARMTPLVRSGRREFYNIET